MKCGLSEGPSQPSGDIGRWMAADGIQEIDRTQMGRHGDAPRQGGELGGREMARLGVHPP